MSKVFPMTLKEMAIDIFRATLAAADPYDLVRRAIAFEGGDIIVAGKRYPAGRYGRIAVIGAGKASARMAAAAEDALGDRITAGWVNTKYGHALPLGRITVHECGHPVPDEAGIAGARRITRILEEADDRTLVLCLLSGGGSALLPDPAAGITLDDLQGATKLLMLAGADITELNAVRKHLSILKGGGMARIAAPAALHILILSDVIGDRLDTIASGPAVADDTTFGDCLSICRRFDVLKDLPQTVRERLERGAAGDIPETAKPGDAFLACVANSVIGGNRLAVEAARRRAESYGYRTLVLSTVLRGEARELGNVFAALAYEIKASGNPVPPPACIIGGGETTVTVRGDGLGGRNQEMAAAAAAGIEGMDECVFLSGGTDGTDGPTDAAGGVVDGGTLDRARERGLDLEDTLARNDSYTWLGQAGGLLVTGPTGTNVMDIQLLLVGRPC